MSRDNKILYKMTIDNIPANLNMFYNLITELFNSIKKIDEKIHKKDDILYTKLPFLQKIEKRLNG